MADKTLQDARTWIEGQVKKFMPHVGGKSEKTDDFLRLKLQVLLDALDGLNENADVASYGEYVLRLYRAHQGALDGLHDLLNELGVPHRHG